MSASSGTSRSRAILLASSAGIILALVVYDVFKRRRRKESTSNRDRTRKSSSFSSREIDTSLLPSHLERDVQQERRWQRMMPKLAMKKPLYDNILMKDPDGAILCSVSLKKANWYVGKKLAAWESKPTDDEATDNEQSSIRLLFTPRANSSSTSTEEATSDAGQDDESRHVRLNRCVVCGRDDPQAYYMRHSIVPYSLRSQFPAQYKTHLPHDIVVLCAETCHVPAAQYANERVRELEHAVWQSTTPPEKYIVDAELRRVKTAATTLLRRRNQLPAKRVEELERIVMEHYQPLQSGGDGTSTTTSVSDNFLLDASQLTDRALNPDYVTGAERIMQFLSEQADLDEALTDFIKDWRRHFLEMMQPAYLPYGWSVDSPVKSDDRSY